MDCIVIAIVWTIAAASVPTWYNATHNYANSSRNSSCLKNRRCESSLSPEYVIETGTKSAQLCKCQTCVMRNELDKRFG